MSAAGTNKLKGAREHRVPVLWGAGLFLEALLNRSGIVPKVPHPGGDVRLCLMCKQSVIQLALDRHYKGEQTGLVWIWSENLLIKRKLDFDKVCNMLRSHLALLKPILDVSRITYIVDEQAFICHECMESHVRSLHELYGVPYAEECEAGTNGGASASVVAGNSTPHSVAPDRNTVADGDTDRVETHDP